uniref:Hydroxysteroid 11-beta-dehydrogenase 1-like protein n=1 Tax=Phallusia mammillata TaxID=59560 RepID=A0A6F9DFH5_9ASCI|nr:hydroxysteroid 11-beta-dehydrogenase 1-like protein [Phallusia mammillata]
MAGLKMKAAVVAAIAVMVYFGYFRRKPQYNPAEVAGLRVVVTGSSTGIGEQVAYKFASMGAKVLVTARTESKLQNVVKKCKELGSPESYYVAVSMGSYKNASKVIDMAMEKFGGIDVLILNHVDSGSILGGYQHNVAKIERALMTNTWTHAHMATVALENLIKNKGRIVAVSSAAGMVGVPLQVEYSTSKFALNGFFTSLRQELRFNKTTEVSISLCNLGFIDTDMATNLQKYIHSDLYSKIECAAEIVRGAMMRDRDIFFPDNIVQLSIIKDIIPDYVEKLIREEYHAPGSL